MNHVLSYSITSLTDEKTNSIFTIAKEKFGLLVEQKKTSDKNYILKNLAHLTLKRKFFLRTTSLESELVERLKKIRFQPIEITADEVDLFVSERFGNILVATVSNTEALHSLHEEIVSAVSSYTDNDPVTHEKGNFTPHLSILYYLPEEKIEEATMYAEKHILPVTYTLTSFMLMKDVPGIKGERELVSQYE